MVLDKENKKYEKPTIEEEIIFLEDIIALSSVTVLGEIADDDGERLWI